MGGGWLWPSSAAAESNKPQGVRLIPPPEVTQTGDAEVRVRVPAWRLRIAEKLVLGFSAYGVVASSIFPLSLRERLAVILLNVAASSALFLLSRISAQRPSRFLGTVRDWLPAILIILAYRESGLFFIPDPRHRLDFLFVHWDNMLLKNGLVQGGLTLFSPWLQRYLEFSYFFCYPMIPLGLAALLVARRRGALQGPGADQAVDRFWTTVLMALFTCYVLFPLFPSTTPRLFFHDFPGPAVDPLFRKINTWLAGQYGIHSSVFPSGHVAGVVAVALAVRAYLPRLGLVCLVAAASIGIATVIGRYHYVADAAAGALIGILAFLISNRIHKS